MCPFPGKTLCGECSKPVQMIRVGGEMLAVDPEIMAVVATGQSGARITGRRVHADLCGTYKIAKERAAAAAKIKQELAAYNRAGRRKSL